MNALMRLVAAVLTVAAAVDIVLLVSAATDSTAEIRVLNFALFAIGAVAALVVAGLLWRQANRRR